MCRIVRNAVVVSQKHEIRSRTPSGRIIAVGLEMTGEDPFDLVGDVLDGQFRVDAFAGEGDLSVVYKGHHLGIDAPVAIKCLNLPATLDPALVRPLVESFREASRVHYRLRAAACTSPRASAPGRRSRPARA